MKPILLITLAATTLASSQAAVIVQWNFEGETLAPSTGAGIASITTDGTTSFPNGWGSTDSWSSNNWNVGEYFQFTLSTSGYEGISLTWQQAGSASGPADFALFYSTNGTDFTNAGSYSVPDQTWSTTNSPAASVKSFDLTSISALNNSNTVFFRLQSTSTVRISGTDPVANTGSSRVDNFTVNANPVPEPSTALFGGLGLLALLRRRRA